MRNKIARNLGIAVAGVGLAVGGIVVAGQANADVNAIGDTWAVSNRTNPGHFCTGTTRGDNPTFIEVDLQCMIRDLSHNRGLEQANHYQATDNRSHRTRTALEINLAPGNITAVLRLSPIA